MADEAPTYASPVHAQVRTREETLRRSNRFPANPTSPCHGQRTSNRSQDQISEKKLRLVQVLRCSLHITKIRTTSKKETIMTVLIIYSLISLAGCASMAVLDLRKTSRRT
ncbi:MAG: hypothetical protein DRP71_04770 [Verrucomicrobia bacterium]|nr:MAG: hypothetical protein DRP71_04770 [Verrucomicrobiota bacterium]